MEPDAAAAKRELRARMKRVLSALPRDLAESESAAACRILAREFPPRPGAVVLATLPIPGEIDLRAYLMRTLDSGGRVVLPRVEPGGRLSLWSVRSLGEVVSGPLGLSEPDPRRAETVGPDAVSLALVPGLAFDARGGRLGRGGGFFDRLLTQLAGRVPLVAVCHSCQVVGEVPLESHDVRVDRVIAGHGELGIGR